MPTSRSTCLRLGLASLVSLLAALNLRIALQQSHDVDRAPLMPGAGSPAEMVTSLHTRARSPKIQHPARPPPPLQSIVNGWNITGDASWLLSFSIIGFPKCGTSTLMIHLGNHPQVRIFKDERCDMSYRRQAVLIRDLYNGFQPVGSAELVRGIKCPGDLENTKLAIPNYQKFFPKTRYIVGIRHPILWFESFYNFRINNGFPMPPPHDLVGRCMKGSFNVCTFRGNFHLFLARLGKTSLTDTETALMGPYRHIILGDEVKPLETRVRQPLFLYDVSQLSDKNRTRAARLRLDLQAFLRLKEPISPMIRIKPGVNHTSLPKKVAVDTLKIDICQPQFEDIRAVLLEQAVNASTWIRQHFVHSPTVVVSSKDYFIHDLMASWKRDPCLGRAKVAVGAIST